MRELIFLEPVVKKLIWGKEYWTVSAHESGDCLVREEHMTVFICHSCGVITKRSSEWKRTVIFLS